MYLFSGAPPGWPRLRPFSILIAALHSSQQQMQTRQGHSAGCPFLLFAHLHVNTSFTVSSEGEHRNPSYKYTGWHSSILHDALVIFERPGPSCKASCQARLYNNRGTRMLQHQGHLTIAATSAQRQGRAMDNHPTLHKSTGHIDCAFLLSYPAIYPHMTLTQAVAMLGNSPVTQLQDSARDAHSAGLNGWLWGSSVSVAHYSWIIDHACMGSCL